MARIRCWKVGLVTPFETSIYQAYRHSRDRPDDLPFATAKHMAQKYTDARETVANTHTKGYKKTFTLVIISKGLPVRILFVCADASISR